MNSGGECRFPVEPFGFCPTWRSGASEAEIEHSCGKAGEEELDYGWRGIIQASVRPGLQIKQIWIQLGGLSNGSIYKPIYMHTYM